MLTEPKSTSAVILSPGTPAASVSVTGPMGRNSSS